LDSVRDVVFDLKLGLKIKKEMKIKKGMKSSQLKQHVGHHVKRNKPGTERQT
jgi:hypothetical protein